MSATTLIPGSHCAICDTIVLSPCTRAQLFGRRGFAGEVIHPRDLHPLLAQRIGVVSGGVFHRAAVEHLDRQLIRTLRGDAAQNRRHLALDLPRVLRANDLGAVHHDVVPVEVAAAHVLAIEALIDMGQVKQPGSVRSVVRFLRKIFESCASLPVC